MDYNLSRANHASDLHSELFTEVKPSHVGIFSQVTRHARSKDLSFSHDVRSISNAQRLAYIVIGDEDADAATAQLQDDTLDVVDRLWIDAGERFV